MKCPTCENSDLMMTERAEITIDFCPLCRGVWLDRGELDKIIERSARNTLPAATTEPTLSTPDHPAHDRARPARSSERREWDDDDDDRPRYKKKESFWSQLFDFD
jgi:uncharacterized protein